MSNSIDIQNDNFLSIKSLTSLPRVTFNHSINYKEKANILFDKLNSFKANLQNQKYLKFSQLFNQLKIIQNNLDLNQNEKQQHFEQLLTTLNQINNQINQQNIELNRFKKLLSNIMESTNRQCQIFFDKMTKQNQNNQLMITNFIDLKIQSFILKNKGVWLQEDILNFEPFKQELNYLKKQVEQFYKNQQKEIDRLKKDILNNLDKQKQFLLKEIKRTDYEDITKVIETVHSDITKKVTQMKLKRQNVEKNVFSMIENVIDSYIKDSNKFK